MSGRAAESVPTPAGPYVPAACAGGLVFCSGQLPVDPGTGALVGGGIGAATRQVLANVEAVLGGVGATLGDVVKTTVFLTDLSDFEAMNAAYAEVFGAHKPARSTVQVAALPKGAAIEIEAVAAVAPCRPRATPLRSP